MRITQTAMPQGIKFVHSDFSQSTIHNLRKGIQCKKSTNSKRTYWIGRQLVTALTNAHQKNRQIRVTWYNKWNINIKPQILEQFHIQYEVKIKTAFVLLLLLYRLSVSYSLLHSCCFTFCLPQSSEQLHIQAILESNIYHPCSARAVMLDISDTRFIYLLTCWVIVRASTDRRTVPTAIRVTSVREQLRGWWWRMLFLDTDRFPSTCEWHASMCCSNAVSSVRRHCSRFSARHQPVFTARSNVPFTQIVLNRAWKSSFVGRQPGRRFQSCGKPELITHC